MADLNVAAGNKKAMSRAILWQGLANLFEGIGSSKAYMENKETTSKFADLLNKYVAADNDYKQAMMQFLKEEAKKSNVVSQGNRIIIPEDNSIQRQTTTDAEGGNQGEVIEGETTDESGLEDAPPAETDAFKDVTTEPIDIQADPMEFAPKVLAPTHKGYDALDKAREMIAGLTGQGEIGKFSAAQLLELLQGTQAQQTDNYYLSSVDGQTSQVSLKNPGLVYPLGKGSQEDYAVVDRGEPYIMDDPENPLHGQYVANVLMVNRNNPSDTYTIVVRSRDPLEAAKLDIKSRGRSGTSGYSPPFDPTQSNYQAFVGEARRLEQETDQLRQLINSPQVSDEERAKFEQQLRDKEIALNRYAYDANQSYGVEVSYLTRGVGRNMEYPQVKMLQEANAKLLTIPTGVGSVKDEIARFNSLPFVSESEVAAFAGNIAQWIQASSLSPVEQQLLLDYYTNPESGGFIYSQQIRMGRQNANKIINP